MGIEKGRPSEQSPKMKGIFYEAMQEKKLSESPKPLILLGFSKSSVSPFVPTSSTEKDIGAENPETTRFLGFFMLIFKVEFKRYHFPKSTFGENLN